MENLSNERLLQGTRNLKAKGYTPQQVNAWLLTNGSSLDAMKEFAKQQKNALPQDSDNSPALVLTDEQKAKIQAAKDAYNRKGWFRLMQAIDDFNSGFGEGTISGLERVANGATFGGYDNLVDGAKERKQALQERADSVGIGGLNRAINKATEDAGAAWSMVGAGKALKGVGALGKGASKTSKVAQALLAPELSSIAPVAAGGFTEGAIDPESTIGKIITNLGGGILFEGLRSIPKRTYQTFKTGLENIVNDTDALKVVRRGAKIDDDVAKAVIRDTSDVANNINQSTAQEVERHLGEKIDTQKAIEDAKKIYGNYVDQNMNKKTGFVKNPRDFNDFMQDEYDDAIKEGLRRAPKGSVPFGLAHINEAKKLINDKINKSFITKGLKVEPTEDTYLLMKVREAMEKPLQNAGIKPYDAIVKQAKDMDYLYNLGREYKPSNIKYSDIDFGRPKGPMTEQDIDRYIMRRKAFKSGLKENILYNSKPQQNLSKEVKNYQNILKEFISNDKYNNTYKKFMNKLSENETAFNRLIKLAGISENKLTTPEASRIFLREQYESAGAAKGALLDAILGRLSSGYYKKSAQKLLDGNGESVDILTSPVYQQVITNILKGNARGLGANSRLISAKALADALKDE